MDRSRADRILSEWSAVADQARRPAIAPQPARFRSSLSLATLAGGAVLAVALVVGVASLGNRGPNGQVGGPLPSATSTDIATPNATPKPTPTPVVSATATPRPTIRACAAADVTIRITMWEGAAGHRIAHADLTRQGSGPCVFAMAMRPSLIDGNRTVLIDGTTPVASGPFVLVAGEHLTTLVDTDNYCGTTNPRPPVTIAFFLEDGTHITAAPPSPNDVTVPPCNGSPGSRGHIQMHPWAQS